VLFTQSGCLEPLDLNIGSVNNSTFIFYNIFQWNPRKNPEDLIRVYFNTFKKDEDVILLLKSYVTEGSQREFLYVSEQINKIKLDMGLQSYPRIALITSMMSEEQVLSLHKRGHCLVSLHNSEGFGLVPFDAGLANNIVIATGATGNMEYMSKFNSYPVDFKWTYVTGMSFFNRWYRGDGLWAQPDLLHASELMRYVYENKSEARDRCINLKKYICENFSWEIIANTMLCRLNEV
jgi:glycosyltransferase involved in cell wall biosynthesis